MNSYSGEPHLIVQYVCKNKSINLSAAKINKLLLSVGEWNSIMRK